MSDTDIIEEETPPKQSKMPVIIGLVLAVLGGAGGFYAVSSGTILSAESGEVATETETLSKDAQISFVSVDPLTISLGGSANADHLRFRADLEVPTMYKDEVAQMLPRVVDVLNSYLRALEPRDLEARAALTRLRAQMLRRVQVVVGEGRVNDLLVMEFVLN